MKMYFEKNSKFVKITNKGFILLDMLFALSLFLVIVSFIPPTLKIIGNNQIVAIQLKEMEWQLFVSQLKKEVRMSENIYVENNKLFMYIDGENIQYELYTDKIRRRVNAAGHEVTLQDVAAVQFSEIQNGVKVKVKNKYNQQKEVLIWNYLQHEGGNNGT
ncbi:MAG: competence type IV pilus minor pilin ComGF [Bacillus sp. (in: firmicutes)]